MKSMLSHFLDAGQLPIGDHDEKLTLLQNAAETVKNKFIARPTMIARATIVGLDANVLASDPLYTIVSEAITAQWQTMQNKVGADPVQIYRAIVLTALQAVSDDDAKFIRPILLSASPVPEDRFGKGEANAIRTFLSDLRAKDILATESDWETELNIVLPKNTSKPRKVAGKAEFILALLRARGPKEKEDGEAVPTANPNWPDSGEPWAYVFAEKAGEAIHAAITSAQKANADENTEALRDSLSPVAEVLGRFALRDAKSELLWIKESSYSPSARKRYNDLSSLDALAHAVIDVSRVVGTSSAESMEWFLHDLVASRSDERVKIEDILPKIGVVLQAEEEADFVRKHSLPARGRRTLFEIAIEPEPNAEFTAQSGIVSGFDESLPLLSIRLFRELQAAKILAS